MKLEDEGSNNVPFQPIRSINLYIYQLLQRLVKDTKLNIFRFINQFELS